MKKQAKREVTGLTEDPAEKYSRGERVVKSQNLKSLGSTKESKAFVTIDFYF